MKIFHNKNLRTKYGICVMCNNIEIDKKFDYYYTKVNKKLIHNFNFFCFLLEVISLKIKYKIKIGIQGIPITAIK